MKKIGFLYGSDTGCTEVVVNQITSLLTDDLLDVYDMDSSNDVNPFSRHDYLLVGVPMYSNGWLHNDEGKLSRQFSNTSFKSKTVDVYDLGDRMSYGEYFAEYLESKIIKLLLQQLQNDKLMLLNMKNELSEMFTNTQCNR